MRTGSRLLFVVQARASKPLLLGRSLTGPLLCEAQGTFRRIVLHQDQHRPVGAQWVARVAVESAVEVLTADVAFHDLPVPEEVRPQGGAVRIEQCELPGLVLRRIVQLKNQLEPGADQLHVAHRGDVLPLHELRVALLRQVDQVNLVRGRDQRDPRRALTVQRDGGVGDLVECQILLLATEWVAALHPGLLVAAAEAFDHVLLGEALSIKARAFPEDVEHRARGQVTDPRHAYLASLDREAGNGPVEELHRVHLIAGLVAGVGGQDDLLNITAQQQGVQVALEEPIGSDLQRAITHELEASVDVEHSELVPSLFDEAEEVKDPSLDRTDGLAVAHHHAQERLILDQVLPPHHAESGGEQGAGRVDRRHDVVAEGVRIELVPLRQVDGLSLEQAEVVAGGVATCRGQGDQAEVVVHLLDREHVVALAGGHLVTALESGPDAPAAHQGARLDRLVAEELDLDLVATVVAALDQGQLAVDVAHGRSVLLSEVDAILTEPLLPEIGVDDLQVADVQCDVAAAALVVPSTAGPQVLALLGVLQGGEHVEAVPGMFPGPADPDEIAVVVEPGVAQAAQVLATDLVDGPILRSTGVDATNVRHGILPFGCRQIVIVRNIRRFAVRRWM